MSKSAVVTTRVTADLSVQIDLLAKELDRSRAWVTAKAVERYVQEELEFIAFVHEGEPLALPPSTAASNFARPSSSASSCDRIVSTSCGCGLWMGPCSWSPEEEEATPTPEGRP